MRTRELFEKEGDIGLELRNEATPETTTNSNQIPRSRELAVERQLRQ